MLKELGMEDLKGFAQCKYEQSDTVEELIRWLAYAVLGNSYTIFKNFHVKRRGVYIWRILIRLNPGKYWKEKRRIENLLFESVSIVINSLRPIFLQSLPSDTVDEILDTTADFAALQVSKMWHLSIQEAGGLSFRLKKIIESGKDREKDSMSRDATVLLEIYEEELTPSQLGGLMKSLLDPWFFVYPRDFVKRYMYLTAR